MKVHSSKDRFERFGNKNARDKTHGGEFLGSSEITKTGAFKEILDIKKEKVADRSIFEMMSELDKLGQQLEKFTSIADYARYKAAVKKIVKSLVPNAFSINKTFSQPSVRNPQTREYHIITAIDEELLSLLELVKKKERDNMKIAGKVVRIKGLIIDCYR